MTLQTIDADAHITEPPDLWTSRLPRKWKDQAPHLERDKDGSERWKIGSRWSTPVGYYSQAGWREVYPSMPQSYEDMDPAFGGADARLRWMDEHEIWAQIIYPNVVSFDSSMFMELEIPLANACVSAYNDFVREWAEADSQRLIPMMMVPLWDVDASVAEIDRCAGLGFRGAMFGGHLERAHLPPVFDPAWDDIWNAMSENGLSCNFHIGVNSSDADTAAERTNTITKSEYTRVVKHTALGFASNMSTICDIVLGGVCDRFPDLTLVSVESGFGYIPYLLEMLDWQWKNTGGRQRYPARILPSEYFLRQMIATFWFEQESLGLLEKYQDNVMFETDFPHPTCLCPGPHSTAPSPRDVVARHARNLPETVLRKVMHDNAARIYRID